MNKLLFTDTFRHLIRFSTVRTDNNVFRLHYRVTGALLFSFSVLVTATQFFGNPIYCITHDAVPQNVMNTYCWIEGTITLPRSLNKTVGTEVAAPGVDKIRDGDHVIEHAYYQWVCFVLFLQALMFYFPRWLWRGWERGRIGSLILNMNKPVLGKDEKEANVKAVVDYFMKHRNQHQAYAMRYFLCEVLNLVNVMGQIFFINRFLGGMFTTYGTEVIQFLNEDPEVRYDPMIRIFPKMTKCRFHRFGTSGDVQKHDSICLLPLNIINEKVYIFLWFWLIILAAVSALGIIYRVVVCGFPRYRTLLLSALSRMVNRGDMGHIVRKAQYGDWFVLYLLKDNVQGLFFRDVVEEFAKRLKLEPEPDQYDGGRA